MLQFSIREAQNVWLTRQRLTCTQSFGVTETVGSIGWMPIPTIASAYIGLYARGALRARHDLDEVVVKRGELVVVPGPRGLSWLVPTAEAPLARAFAKADHASREARIAASGTLTSRDLEGAKDALRSAMSAVVTLDDLRKKIPEKFFRSLGDAGKKCGLPTIASLVLREMWVNGEVVRVWDHRADGEHSRWAIDPRPRVVPDAADAVTTVVSRWLSAFAPVSTKQCVSAFGIALGRVGSSLKAIKANQVEVTGMEGPCWVPQDFTEKVAQDTQDETTNVRFLPVRDGLIDVHGHWLFPVGDPRVNFPRGLLGTPLVLVRGEIVGTWFYDDVVRMVTWRPLSESSSTVDGAMQTMIDTQAREFGALIQKEFGKLAQHGPTLSTAKRASGSRGNVELSIEL